jgi:hypothetical protein
MGFLVRDLTFYCEIYMVSTLACRSFPLELRHYLVVADLSSRSTSIINICHSFQYSILSLVIYFSTLSSPARHLALYPQPRSSQTAALELQL